MKSLRIVLPLLALAGLLSAGCVLTSAQVLASFALPSPFTVLDVVGVPVDLTTVDAYQKHKDKLHDVVDLAVLGRFTNNGPGTTGVLVYLQPDQTKPLYLTSSQLLADPTVVRLWGPYTQPAGSVTAIEWDQSAALFGPGRSALVNEIKGDGKFTLYFVETAVVSSRPSRARPAGAVETPPTPRFTIDSGALAVVLDAGL